MIELIFWIYARLNFQEIISKNEIRRLKLCLNVYYMTLFVVYGQSYSSKLTYCDYFCV